MDKGPAKDINKELIISWIQVSKTTRLYRLSLTCISPILQIILPKQTLTHNWQHKTSKTSCGYWTIRERQQNKNCASDEFHLNCKIIWHSWFWCTFWFFFLIFIYLWLCWVFISVRGLSPVVAGGGHSSSRCEGLSLSRPLLLRSTGSRRAGSAIVAHGPSCSAACGIFPDQGSNPCPLHWQADSQPLRHQGSPTF